MPQSLKREISAARGLNSFGVLKQANDVEFFDSKLFKASDIFSSLGPMTCEMCGRMFEGLVASLLLVVWQGAPSYLAPSSNARNY